MAIQKHYWMFMTYVAMTWLLVSYVAILDMKYNFQDDAIQRAQHECKLDNNKCHPQAYCYNNDIFYECICIFGWDGDGFVGDGHLGCRRRQPPKSQVAACILVSILTGLMLLWFLVEIIVDYIRLIARIRNNTHVALARQAYLHQGVALGVAEAVQASSL